MGKATVWVYFAVDAKEIELLKFQVLFYLFIYFDKYENYIYN